MATVTTSVSGLSGVADDGTDTGTLNITSGNAGSGEPQWPHRVFHGQRHVECRAYHQRAGDVSGEGRGDTIGEFNVTASDVMRLSAGITWTASDVGCAALVTFSNGATVTLTGVSGSSVVDGWFTTG